MTGIDTSGIDMVRELRKILEKRSLQVRIALELHSLQHVPCSIQANISLTNLPVFTAACVGKSCWKCDGKAASVKSLGGFRIEWTISHSWRSCSRHFIFVESSTMNFTGLQRRKEKGRIMRELTN